MRTRIRNRKAPHLMIQIMVTRDLAFTVIINIINQKITIMMIERDSVATD